MIFHLGGLLGINDTWFRKRNDLQEGNFNDCQQTGVYYVKGYNANTPLDSWGILTVINSVDSILQWYVPHDNHVRYTRVSVNSNWTEWNSF